MDRISRVTRDLSVVLIAFAGLASQPSAALPPIGAFTPEQNYQLALEAQTARDYRNMVSHLRHAAAAGHLEAQELLGMALLVGSNVYGRTVPAQRCEATEWMRRAAAQGSEVARFHVDFMNRLRHAPSGTQACKGAGIDIRDQ
jgi:hypothetical protein